MRTPQAVSRLTSRVATRVELASSPAQQLLQAADRGMHKAQSKLAELWERCALEARIDSVREQISSVLAVQLAVLTLESSFLQWSTMQWAHAFDTPAVSAVGLGSHSIYAPDVRVLMNRSFWAPALLWSLTSMFIPIWTAYFVNLTVRSNTRYKTSRPPYAVDPLMFNITKALLQYLAYCPTKEFDHVGDATIAKLNVHPWGLFSEQTVQTVYANVPGSYVGLQIGAAVGALVSLYDASLRK